MNRPIPLLRKGLTWVLAGSRDTFGRDLQRGG